MNEFYKVEWNGVLLKYHKIGVDKDNIPKWTSKNMMDCNQFEEWKIKEVSFNEWIGYSTFSEDYAINKIERSFINLEDAKKVSKELWNEHFAPNAKYRVVRYFDNIFDGYESDILSKRDAYERMESIPKRYLYSYELKIVNK